MPLPYSFVLGLFCLVLAPSLGTGLPRNVEFGSVLPYLALVFAPWLAGRVLGVPFGPRPGRRRARLRALLRLLSVPAAFFALLGPGGYSEWVEQTVGSSYALSTALGILPLLLMELGAQFARRQSARRHAWLAVDSGPAPFHLRLVFVLVVLVLLLTVVLDLAMSQRWSKAFVSTTTLGNFLGTLAIMGVLLLALPFVFRFVLWSSVERPGDDVLQTAAGLGFPSDNVKILRTGNRLVNAMLVGVVPYGRYLFVTDGLVDVLDPVSLRSVVAHEVGHARANHPLLLIVVFGLIPLLLLAPLEVWGVFEWDPIILGGAALLCVPLVVLAVRRFSHRSELEADLMSADALGGSAPGILALHKASLLSGAGSNVETLRHPSEERRILHLLSCEGDPWFRDRFERRGRILRRCIVAALVLALGLTTWAHAMLWRIDASLVQYFTGRFAAADRTLDTLPANLPAGRAAVVADLREELAAARTLCPEGGDWEKISADLATRALRRGQQELVRNGPVTARPWFAIGMAKERATPLERSLYLYCQAMAEADDSRARELRAYLLGGLVIDAPLRAALRRDARSAR